MDKNFNKFWKKTKWSKTTTATKESIEIEKTIDEYGVMYKFAAGAVFHWANVGIEGSNIGAKGLIIATWNPNKMINPKGRSVVRYYAPMCRGEAFLEEEKHFKNEIQLIKYCCSKIHICYDKTPDEEDCSSVNVLLKFFEEHDSEVVVNMGGARIANGW